MIHFPEIWYLFLYAQSLPFSTENQKLYTPWQGKWSMLYILPLAIWLNEFLID
jgi:hypothetical protein